MYKLLSGPSSNARFHIQIQDTDYTKQRSIDTMTPNRLAVYFVADMVVADIVAPPSESREGNRTEPEPNEPN